MRILVIEDDGNTAAFIKKALTEMPPAAQFTWRAICEWLGGVHSKSTVETFSGAGAE